MPCGKPPEGWSCSRKTGHDGPCAARPEKPEFFDVNVTVDAPCLGRFTLKAEGMPLGKPEYAFAEFTAALIDLVHQIKPGDIEVLESRGYRVEQKRNANAE